MICSINLCVTSVCSVSWGRFVVAVVSASPMFSNHVVMSVFHLLMSGCKYVMTSVLSWQLISFSMSGNLSSINFDLSNTVADGASWCSTLAKCCLILCVCCCVSTRCALSFSLWSLFNLLTVSFAVAWHCSIVENSLSTIVCSFVLASDNNVSISLCSVSQLVDTFLINKDIALTVQSNLMLMSCNGFKVWLISAINLSSAFDSSKQLCC